MMPEFLQFAADRLLQAPLTPMERVDSIRRGLENSPVTNVWWLLAAGMGGITLASAAYLLLTWMRSRKRAPLAYRSSAEGGAAAPKRTKPDRSGGLPTRLIPADAEITILDSSGRALRGWVETPGGKALVLRHLTGVPNAQPGEVLRIRYSHRYSFMEFDTEVLSAGPQEIRLRHTDQMRLVNRRRFPRVPTSRPAMVAILPFHAGSHQMKPPAFEPCRLIEIAGPGILLETALPAEIGSRIVAILHFPDGMVVQAAGQILRAVPGADGRTTLAAELLNLSPDELAEMTRQTNEAARACGVLVSDDRPVAAAPVAH